MHNELPKQPSTSQTAEYASMIAKKMIENRQGNESDDGLKGSVFLRAQ